MGSVKQKDLKKESYSDQQKHIFANWSPGRIPLSPGYNPRILLRYTTNLDTKLEYIIQNLLEVK